ncbi:hypothetical protein FH972_022722 [Carpinus fangiana]|uniref:Uncharacterized protein n=1 Tax=Carpinus fangiana TaxID=176857 RepID=A0A5N6KTF8_9ROSI|nr:hypothetical protein FH972_022722 [Carpinus fangiana]
MAGSRQATAIVLGSSSPLPAAIAVSSASRSPNRTLTGARTWDIPYHHSSSPPPMLVFPRKQPAVPVLRAGSRAEPIPVGAATGFRSAREVVAEIGLQESEELGQEVRGETAARKKANSKTDNREKLARGKKRKSDEVQDDVEEVDATPERLAKNARDLIGGFRYREGGHLAVEKTYIASARPQFDSVVPTRKKRKSEESTASELHPGDGGLGKLKRVKKVAAVDASATVEVTHGKEAAEQAKAKKKNEGKETNGASKPEKQTKLSEKVDQGIPLPAPKSLRNGKDSSETARAAFLFPQSLEDSQSQKVRLREADAGGGKSLQQANAVLPAVGTGNDKGLEAIPIPTDLREASRFNGPDNPTTLPANKSLVQAIAPSHVHLDQRIQLEAKSVHQLEFQPGLAPPMPAPKQSKPQSKSSRTVTGIVLAQYRSPEKETAKATTDFFAAQPYDAKQLLALEPTVDGGNPKKKRATKSKSKKPAPPLPTKLLSPGQLKRRMQHQEVLFGTSSQLATEESPKTIRALQQAYKESEQATVDLTSPSPMKVQDSVSRFGVLQATRSLWSAAARDEEEAMFTPSPRLRVEHEIGHSSDFEDVDMIGNTQRMEHAVKIAEEQSSRLKLSSAPKRAAPRMRIVNSPSFTMISPPSVVQTAYLSTTASASASKQPTPTLEESNPLPEAPPAKKPRGRPRKADNADAPDPSAASLVKKPRGRPRKDPNAEPSKSKPRKATTTSKKQPTTTKKQLVASEDFIPIEDAIVDLNPPPTPSPPRRRASAAKPLPLELTPSSSAEAAAASHEPVATNLMKLGFMQPYEIRRAMENPDNIEYMKVLFPQITQAVKSAPRGTVDAPSWWEKILMAGVSSGTVA